MSTKHIALLAASTTMISACQSQPDEANVAIASSSLSEITHVPMGQARIMEQGGQLFATNMRTTADGVRSMFQPVVSWEAELDWADNTTAIRMNAINSRLSGEDVVTRLGLDRVNANQWKLSGDFVSPSYLINVYDGDQLVGKLKPGQTQPVLLDWPPVSPILVHWFRRIFESNNPITYTTMQQCGFELALPEGVTVSQGSRVLHGDRVQIIEDGHEPYGGADEMQVLGNGNVTYLSEQVVNE
jgi:hypothetical protein